MPSTLFRYPTPISMSFQDVGGQVQSAPDPRYAVVSTQLPDGSFFIHGEPGAPIPSDALETIFDGTVSWTWVALASDPVDGVNVTTYCTPHDWDGESTTLGVTAALYPNTALPAGLFDA